jgi:nucleotide-binding universal stress UspA family protein
MGIKDIVVVLDDTARAKAVLTIALEQAQRHQAHLIGLCPLELLMPPDAGLAQDGHPDFITFDYISQLVEDRARERASVVETEFREQLRRSGLRGEWQSPTGFVSTVVAERLRTVDLGIIGQADPDTPLGSMARVVLDDAVLWSGRPVLAVPFSGRFDTVGKNVLIAWRNTREAARAINDALPLIDRDANVTVLSVQPPRESEEDELPTADVAEHLARHGLNATAARTVNDGSISDADAILNYAADIGADLLVAGCYGHSRAREMILGGVSRGLLRRMTVPVLLSH